MRRLRAHAAAADVVHLQWLSVPALDRFLLPAAAAACSPSTTRCRLARGRSRASARCSRAWTRVIAHSEHGAGRVARRWSGDPTACTGFPTAPSTTSPRRPDERPLPAELAAVEGPVILCFGLIRPYKGVDVLLEAFGRISGAELWIVGMPRMDLAPLRRLAERLRGDRAVRRPVHHRPRDPRLLSPRRRRRPPVPRIEQSGVLYTALAFGKAIVASSVGGFTEVGERDGAIRLVRAGGRGGARGGARGAGRRPGNASRAGRRRPRPPRRARTPGTRSPRARSTSTAGSCADNRCRCRRSRSSSGSRRGCSSTPTSAIRWCSRCSRAAAAARRRPPPASLPSVSLIIAAHDEEEVIAGQGRERPRARLPARAARADRRLRRLDRPHGGARPRGRRRPRARAAAGGQGPGPERRGRAGRGRAARVQRRQRELAPRRPAGAGRPLRRRRGRLRLRPGTPARPGRLQPGGRLLALRARRPRARVGPRRGHRRQRRHLRGSRLRVPGARARGQPRPLVPVHAHQARLSRRLRAGGRSPRRRWSPPPRGSSRASGG